jgi:hypothetical protein
MVKIFASGCSLLAALLLAWPVMAAWQVREIRRAEGALDYCVADWRLPDGRHLNLALDAAGRVNLGLVLPRGKFDPKNPLALQVNLDKAWKQVGPARVLAPHILLLDIADKGGFVAAWRAARLLTVAGAGKPMNFALDGKASAVLDELMHCAGQVELTLPPSVQALLEQAGLADGVQVIPPPAGLSVVDVAWQRGALNGGTASFDPGTDFRRAVRGQLAVLKTFCQGLWSEEMGLIVVRAAARQQQGMLSCHSGGVDEVMMVVFYAPGDGTGRYFTFAGSGANRKSVTDAGKAVAAALLTPTAP